MRQAVNWMVQSGGMQMGKLHSIFAKARKRQSLMDKFKKGSLVRHKQTLRLYRVVECPHLQFQPAQIGLLLEDLETEALSPFCFGDVETVSPLEALGEQAIGH